MASSISQVSGHGVWPASRNSRTIRCRRIIHYGLGEGGLFATIFGGRFPALASGVIAHNSGSAAIAASKGGVLAVPIVLLAGTDDEQYRVGRSFSARDAYAFDNHAMVFVHILPKNEIASIQNTLDRRIDL